MEFDFKARFTKSKLKEFADVIIGLSNLTRHKVSSRGWGYLMEQAGYINKSELDKVEEAINRCRREGLLPVDFVAEETARSFSGVDEADERSIESIVKWMLEDVLTGHRYYKPDWWEGEDYYIQMVVEKVDLLNLFYPVCREFHIPIANAKGWSSILQRAEYARRFKEAEDMGLQCVLLYCGDFDPDGERISDSIRKNLEQIADVTWRDGTRGYDPANLIIDRFGLNYDYIIKKNYTWIDNLMTGRGKDLNDPKHPNFKLPYVQAYLKKVGPRKCESNVIVTTPDDAEALCLAAINKYVGQPTLDRFALKVEAAKDEYIEFIEDREIDTKINDIINDL